MQTPDDRVRLDKWLWAARFFKTRNLAIDAINGGKVHLNQQRIKPAKEVHLGDLVQVRIGQVERTVQVLGLSTQRGPAPVAALLYTETADSLQKRAQAAEQRRLEQTPYPNGSGRPTKKNRREIQRFTDNS